MNRRLATVVVLLAVATLPMMAQQSQYAGLEQREIKALSPDAVSGYLAGHGMGFAMAAELNSWPGPKHVLELAEDLDLDAEQVEQTEAAYESMHAEAVKLGAALVDAERKLEGLFAQRAIDEDKLVALVAKIARTRGELRMAHLRAHLEMGKVLSQEQVLKYDALRGYRSGGAQHHHGSHTPAHEHQR